MSLSELLPVLHELPRADKFRAVQYLTLDLAQEENSSIQDGGVYPVWSPFDAHEAATELENYLIHQTGKH